MFDETYYRSNNYAGYLERRDRYKRQVEELHHELLQKVCLDFQNGAVLDYGCAVGFVVKALIDIGYVNVMGYDVSSWAVEYGHNVLGIPPSMMTTNLSNVLQQKWDMTLALDVLEHISQPQLSELLSLLNTNYLLVRIPLSIEDNGRYVLDVSERDKTHVIRLTRASWHRFFALHGYDWLFNINLATFYDSTGVMCAIFRRHTSETT